jgi:hypothetical protein
MIPIAVAGDVKVGEFIACVPDPRRRLDRFREPEIQHLHRAIVADLDIRWLQIAMDDARLVGRLERVDDLAGDRDRIGDRQGAARFEHLGERDAGNQFHDQGTHVTGVLDAVDMRDVGMVEGGECLRLALEASEAIGVTRERVRDDLQCNVALEPRVARPIDLAHATGAERRVDDVGADAGTWRQAHGYADYSALTLSAIRTPGCAC